MHAGSGLFASALLGVSVGLVWRFLFDLVFHGVGYYCTWTLVPEILLVFWCALNTLRRISSVSGRLCSPFLAGLNYWMCHV